MKKYIVKIQESIVYHVEVNAHSVKEAESEAMKIPDKWAEHSGIIDVINITQEMK